MCGLRFINSISFFKNLKAIEPRIKLLKISFGKNLINKYNNDIFRCIWRSLSEY